MVKWKWNIRSGRGIYGKKWFRFYILYDLKNWQHSEIEIFMLRKEGEKGNISRQTLLRNSKVIWPLFCHNTFKLNHTVTKLINDNQLTQNYTSLLVMSVVF